MRLCFNLLTVIDGKLLLPRASSRHTKVISSPQYMPWSQVIKHTEVISSPQYMLWSQVLIHTAPCGRGTVVSIVYCRCTY